MKLLRAGMAVAALLLAGGLQAATPKAPGKSSPPAVETPKIKGLEIARPQGTYLGLELVNNTFVLSFYDAEKKKTAPDVARATLRWPVKYQPTDERLVLNPGADGTSLSSPRIIRPPHNFRLSIMLFVEGNDDPVEAYNVSYVP